MKVTANYKPTKLKHNVVISYPFHHNNCNLTVTYHTDFNKLLCIVSEIRTITYPYHQTEVSNTDNIFTKPKRVLN